VSVIKSGDDFLFSIGLRENELNAKPSLNYTNFKKFVEEEKEPCKKDITFVKTHLRSICRIRHTGYIGQIHWLNTNPYGRFPGSKCPVLVKMLNDTHMGSICSYSVQQIEILTGSEKEAALKKINQEIIP